MSREAAALRRGGAVHRTPAAQRQRHKVHLVRYADDFIITGMSKELLRDEVQPLVAHFLKERGLELSHERTSITHVDDGFDVLGQNVRRYGSNLLLKPLRKNVRTFLNMIGDLIQHKGDTSAPVNSSSGLTRRYAAGRSITGTHRVRERSRMSMM